MTRFIERAGATIFVSHFASQVRQVCNKVLVIDKGQVAFFGEVDEGIQIYFKLHEKGPV